MAQAPQAPQAPPTVRLAGAVQAGDAVLLLAATVLAAVDTAAGKSYQAASGIALTAIGLATVGLLLLVALGLARARPWARTPALLTQLFTGIVGIYLVASGPARMGDPGPGPARGRVRRAVRTGQPAGADPRPPGRPRLTRRPGPGRNRPQPARGYSSEVRPSRSCASVLASSRDTCICEIPSSVAICDWVMLPKNRSSRMRFSRG